KKAAPHLPCGRSTLRKAKKTTVKMCLDNPFVFQWKTIDGEDMHFILETLEERIKHIGLKKIESPRKKKRSLTKKQTERKCDAGTSELSKEETETQQQKPGWTDISIRRQLAIGVNEVTKALEKNELLLLLVYFLNAGWSTVLTEQFFQALQCKALEYKVNFTLHLAEVLSALIKNIAQT
uniref:Ribonuclease P/MRP subunit p38 n=1 Tax=Catharus ustulatus TaxID=91951 RepID=A0A8C3TUA5_CATUS